LVEALLAKGADPARRDEFGHTAWDHAVGRAMREAAFAGSGLPALFELLAPPALDVQTDGRLVRLERHQGEYWLLTLMLAGLKTQWSQCVTRRLEPYRYLSGFFADQLHDVLQELPPGCGPRRAAKRTYVNQVLARAEVHSSYQPARRLWVRTKNGHYFPNPRCSCGPARDGNRCTSRWHWPGSTAAAAARSTTGPGRRSRSSGCARRWCGRSRRRQKPGRTRP
jgi:hypothetical protein